MKEERRETYCSGGKTKQFGMLGNAKATISGADEKMETKTIGGGDQQVRKEGKALEQQKKKERGLQGLKHGQTGLLFYKRSTEQSLIGKSQKTSREGKGRENKMPAFIVFVTRKVKATPEKKAPLAEPGPQRWVTGWTCELQAAAGGNPPNKRIRKDQNHQPNMFRRGKAMTGKRLDFGLEN